MGCGKAPRKRTKTQPVFDLANTEKEVKKLADAGKAVPASLIKLMEERTLMVKLLNESRNHNPHTQALANIKQGIHNCRLREMKAEQQWLKDREEIYDDIYHLTGRDLAAGEGVDEAAGRPRHHAAAE